jgi:hypothetical protein
MTTAEKLRQVFSYDCDTGVFVRKISGSNRAKVGSPSGSSNGCGYITLNIDGKNVLAHRMAWLYVNGELPKHGIDHINGDRADNRLVNLRDVPQLVNAQNRRKASPNNRSTGLLGAYRQLHGFTSHIRVKGKQMHLGSFKTAADAHHAYVAAKRVLHEGNTL